MNGQQKPIFEDSAAVLKDVSLRNWEDEFRGQLQKEFLLANVPLAFKEKESLSHVHEVVVEKIYQLLMEDFDTYLNLLYVIDVREMDLKAVDGADIVTAAKQVVFLILQRTYQKLWYKKRYA